MARTTLLAIKFLNIDRLYMSFTRKFNYKRKSSLKKESSFIFHRKLYTDGPTPNNLEMPFYWPAKTTIIPIFNTSSII